MACFSRAGYAESVVGVVMERGIALPVAALAVFRAGGCYLPLDPDDPRLPDLLADARAEMVITLPQYVDRLGGYRTVVLDSALSGLDGLPASPTVAVLPDQAAYLIFTSGTTGRPKGVVVSHRAIASQLAWAQSAYTLSASDRALQKAPLTFDASVSELCWPLVTGATLVLASPGGHRDADYLVDLMDRRAVTVAQFVPSMLNVIVDHERFGELSRLRLMISGGEALSLTLAARFFERFGAGPDRPRLVNVYGPTEAAVWVTTWPCEPGAEIPIPIPIGLPGPEVTAYVLDERLEPVEDGGEGELWLGGAQLARGYQGHPGLTAQRFMPNPLAAGERMYRTGDLVRRRSDGALHYLGRTDQQVKLRGLRVEPGEVEGMLLAHPEVGAAAVVPVQVAGETRLAAYAVPRSGAALAEPSLRAHLAARLPDHLVPAYLVVLDELPRTENGKLDRAALPVPGGEAVAADGASTAETGLLALCAELLGQTPGPDEDFFTLGGHSLLATRLVGLARSRLGLRFTVADVFAQRTVQGLLAVAGADASTAAVQSPVRVPHDVPLPVALVQERVWFMRQIAPHATAYQFQYGIRWRGDLSVPRLEQTLTAIVRRQEILRTTFVEQDGEPRQIVHPPFAVTLPVVPTSEAELAEQVDAFAHTPIDPQRLPLVQWRLFELGPDDHMMVQVEHHLVHDGWSLGVLLRELVAHYRGEPLPELAYQYADIAVWQHEQRRLGRYDADVEYWVRSLRDAPRMLDLPTDRPRPAVPTFVGDVHRVPVSAQLFRELRELAVRNAATPYMVMLAAFEVLLHRYSGATDLVVATGMANRTPDTEPLLGMFVNTLALRLDAGGDPSFRALVERVRQVAEAAHGHQDAPFGDVVARLYRERDLSVNPLSQVMFSFHDAAIPSLDLPGVQGTIVELSNSTAKADLNVIVVARPEQAVGRRIEGKQPDVLLWWEYSTDLFDAATIARMGEQYVALLRAVVAAPDLPISELPFDAADPAERPADQPSAVEPVAQQIARHAATRPDAPAIRDAGGGTVTFAELESRIARVAAGLRAAGLRSEQPVALALGRTPDWIVALLAVLRAGGSFVPLDPAQPSARQESIHADSGASIGLTDAPRSSTASTRWYRLADLPAGDDALDQVAVQPDQLAYVLYTSGSTGEPRGVAVTQRGLANLVGWHRTTYELRPGDRVSHAAGLGFDAVIEEIFPALAAGAAVHLIREDLRTDIPALRAWLCDQQITVAFASTPVAELLFDEDWTSGCALRYLLTGGDRLTRRPPRDLPFTVSNQYGPTENTVVATAGPASPQGDGLPDIGRPIDGVRIRVLDASLRPVPAGVPGELCLGGASIARGYYGRPAMTAAAFVPDPDGVAGARIYRTGDRVRVRSDGRIEFLGRLDDQIKIRGVRIEPAEVEAALGTHPAVAAAAVTADPGRQWLIAYVVPTNGATDHAALTNYLRGRLPAAMVPGRFVDLARLPLTPNGKVDRGALPDPGPAPQVVAEAPSTLAEQRVAAAFATVLRLPAVDRNDNFFMLGGHSLNAAKVVLELGGAVTVADVFTHPTVAALAEALSGDGASAGAVPLETRSR